MNREFRPDSREFTIHCLAPTSLCPGPMLQDLRLGVRLFGRQLSLALAAVVSLALGIGANTAIFSVLHNVVLHQLPYADPERLMIVWETSSENAERWVAPANFVDWRRDTKTFASLAAFDSFSPTLGGRTEPERLRALGVSGTFFTTLGAAAASGRTLLPSDDQPDAPGVAVLSHGLWSRLFGESPDAIGRPLTLDARTYTVVGVMPASFESPLQPDAEIWLSGDRGVPRTFPFGGDVTAVRDSHIIFVVGRLAPGASRAAAQQELTQMMVELAKQHPDTNAGLGVNVVPLHEQVVGTVRPILVLLQFAVGLMLLIACANVAHLLLGQAAGRQAEITMRVALGAGRSRIVRQMLAETLVIAVPGGILGILLAAWGLDALVAMAPQALPRLQEVTLNPFVLAFTAGLTLLTGVLFGLGPAFQLSRYASAAHSPGARLTSTTGVRRWHHAIVIGELALAQVLLIGAGLLLASFMAAQRVPLGFGVEDRIAADLSLTPDRYLQPRANQTSGFRIDPAAKLQFVDAVVSRLQQIPGTRAAAAAFTSPLSGAPNRGISIPGRPRGPGLQEAADFQLITPDFFRAVGVPLVRGRSFTTADRQAAPRVAIVNEAFAALFFPGEEVIGKQVEFGEDFSHEIVGVVADMRYRNVEQPADATFYIPIGQNDERWPFMSFVVWTDGDSAAAIAALRQVVRAADPNQAVTRVRSFDEILGTSLAGRRFNTLMVVLFAGVALVLAAVGIYGVMAYAVAARTREIGVRAALGASPRDLLRMIVGQGARLAGIALVIGIGGALLVTQLMAALLFEITPRDPRTFAAVAGGLAVVALIATWVPARRAVRIDPIAALRDE
jgi:putative ABC transport system permease protein